MTPSGKSFNFWVFVVLALGEASLAQAEGKTWGLSIVGGDDYRDIFQNFYDDGVLGRNEWMKEFGIPADRRQILFGNKSSACFGVTQGLDQERVERMNARLEKNSGDCVAIGDYLQMMMGDRATNVVCDLSSKQFIADQKKFQPQPARNLLDLDGDGENEVTGNSEGPNVKRALEQLMHQTQPGDHVILSMNDHGIKEEGVWKFILPGWDFFKKKRIHLSPKYLKKHFDQLNANGVTVHLDVEACYSGGFSLQLTELNLKSPTCVVALADSESPGAVSASGDFSSFYSKDMKKYGDSLRAFSCALAEDQLNRPNTSLDVIVREWEKKHPATRECAECGHVSEAMNQGPVSRFASRMIEVFHAATPQSAPLREQLLAAFRENIQKVAIACKPTYLFSNPEENDKAFNKAVLACLTNDAAIKTQLTPPITEMLKNYFSSETQTPYVENLLKQHVRFLTEAAPADLDQYKKAMCCLGYNFKTKKNLGFCS